MIDQLNDLYLRWLARQIHYNYRQTTGDSYQSLVMALHNKPFVWTVANDDNRVEDGKELRYNFLTDEELRLEFATFGPNLEQCISEFREQQCSVLEVLIGLSRRAAFMAAGEPGWWAWRLIVNLNLHRMKDPLTIRKVEVINDVLETLIWRTYRSDGLGGFFPLGFPEANQTKVEIWDQMSAYINEFQHP